ncbi:uncharacterized protein METZ01_LOCUS447090, partial [marine metagenome]
TTNSRLCTSVIAADSDNGGWWINDRIYIGADNTYWASTDYDTDPNYRLYVAAGNSYLAGTLNVTGTSTLAAVNPSGVVTLSGGATEDGPTARLAFSNYYDNSGNASFSHIKLYSTTYGFGIAGGTLCYITATSHKFFDDGDLGLTKFQLHITNGYCYADATFGTFVASRRGFCGTYDSSQVQGVWSIGTSFVIDTGADDFGTLYGLGYAYNENGGTPLAEHQIVGFNNGTVGFSLGLTGNLWMYGESWFGSDSTQFNA